MKEDFSIELLNKLSLLNSPQVPMWINESKFGLLTIKKYCRELQKGDNVLEIGCGSGILLSILSSKYADLSFEGIEPFNDGFTSLKSLNSLIKDSGVDVLNISYENLSKTKKYDLIFCINVFEHIEDWKDFLFIVTNLLKKNGKLIILCANYAFPYEHHFSIPIIINKNFTHTLFRRYIDDYEKSINLIGLWKSLNFVKKSKVVDYFNSINQNQFSFLDDISIIDLMINRILSDEEFKKRQGGIGAIALVIKKLKLLEVFKLFPNFLPYMKLEITRVL